VPREYLRRVDSSHDLPGNRAARDLTESVSMAFRISTNDAIGAQLHEL
jgi:hypothetical protein